MLGLRGLLQVSCVQNRNRKSYLLLAARGTLCCLDGDAGLTRMRGRVEALHRLADLRVFVAALKYTGQVNP